MNKGITEIFKKKITDIAKSDMKIDKKIEFLKKAKSLLTSENKPEDKLIDLDLLIKETK